MVFIYLIKHLIWYMKYLPLVAFVVDKLTLLTDNSLNLSCSYSFCTEHHVFIWFKVIPPTCFLPLFSCSCSHPCRRTLYGRHNSCRHPVGASFLMLPVNFSSCRACTQHFEPASSAGRGKRTEICNLEPLLWSHADWTGNVSRACCPLHNSFPNLQESLLHIEK